MNGYDGGEGWEPALQQAVADLKLLGIRELMLSDAPGVGRNPLDCLQRPDATLQTCTFSTPTGKIEADRIQRQMAAQAGIDFVNVR